MKIPFFSRPASDETKPGQSKITYVSGLKAGSKARFGKVLTGIIQDLPDLLAVSVIELHAGELQATYHVPGKLNPGKAAAHNAEVIKQKQRALQALGLGGEVIEDILVTLTSQWHVLRLLPGNRHFVHLMVSSRDTNLGVARDVMHRHTAAAAAPELG